MGHSHLQHADHHDGPQGNISSKAIRAAFFLNLSFTIIEVIGGVFTNSVAILGDAVHDLGDSLVLGAAWFLQHVAQKGRDKKYTYGYARYSMLGGWLTSVVLLVGTTWVMAEAIPRLMKPEEVNVKGMILLAILGIVVNGVAARILNQGNTFNERAVYLHLLEDVLGWIAVLIGGLIMLAFGMPWIDPLLSILISLYIMYQAMQNLRSSTQLLMQATPGEVDEDNARELLLALPHVLDVHDQHIWSLDGTYTIMTIHLVVEERLLEDAISTKQQAHKLLRELGVDHATIEIEVASEHCAQESH